MVHMHDGSAKLESPEERIVIAHTKVDPDRIAGRIAFSKRVGSMAPDGDLSTDQLGRLRAGTYRVRVFELERKADSERLVSRLAEEVGGKVALEDADTELTVVRGKRDYFALSRPSLMRQDWSPRRPRARPFFHPAAIFPKLSRALVNLTRVDAGDVFLDPLCGTGSLLLEAYELGARPVGADRDSRMVRGALRNMSSFGQDWLGVVRADVSRAPFSGVHGIATDIPYGRASSVAGSNTKAIMIRLLETAACLLGREGRLVVMHPDSVEVVRNREFDLEEEHHLYIHRKLTRTISVLRRL